MSAIPPQFRVATRGTTREINSSIALNLVRVHQPISRADLARHMGVRRGAITLIVNDLLERHLLVEGAIAETVRGRKPTFLYIDSRGRGIVAVDIRASGTFLMLADLSGKPLSGVVRLKTVGEPCGLVAALAPRIRSLLADHPEIEVCEGVGVVVPGMVEHTTMRVLHAPTLEWRDVDLREPLAVATGLPVQIENSGRACVLAQAWTVRDGVADAKTDIVFVSVSDGVGVGVMVQGELLRGSHNIAGEFGHLPLSLDGPPCSCGANGCWEAYVSNRALLARYFGRSGGPGAAAPTDDRAFTVEDLVTRARANDARAVAAIETTGHYLGMGLASVIKALDPSRVYIGGEITLAWDLVEGRLRAAMAQRALTPAAAETEIRLVAASEYPRLRGAAALIAAPAFASPNAWFGGSVANRKQEPALI
jgi:predicted NBD/HSP70 family sugar kinase